MRTMLVCSLLDIGGLPITDAFLGDLRLLREAHSLNHVTLYQPSRGTWKTMHPRWDEEMLSILYNERDEVELADNKQFLNDALDSIFKIKEAKINANEERAYTIIGTIYDLAARGVISIDLVESIIQIPSHFTVEQKSMLYTFYIAATYSKLGKLQNAIHYLTEAIRLKSSFSPAWINKGIAFHNLGKYEEARECYDKAFEIDPNSAKAYYNKALALDFLRKYEEAIKCYDKSIKNEPNYTAAWLNKGTAFTNLGKHEDAIECFDSAINLDPSYARAWNNKGSALNALRKYIDAIECFDSAINLDPNAYLIWYNKSIALSNLGKQNEADRCFSKAKELGFK